MKIEISDEKSQGKKLNNWLLKDKHLTFFWCTFFDKALIL